MRRLVFIVCAISLICLPLSTIQAAPDSGKEETTTSKAHESQPHQDNKETNKDKEKEKAEKEKESSAAKEAAGDAKPAAQATKPAEKAVKKAAEKVITKPVIVRFTLTGAYPEGAGAPGLFGEILKPCGTTWKTAGWTAMAPKPSCGAWTPPRPTKTSRPSG